MQIIAHMNLFYILHIHDLHLFLSKDCKYQEDDDSTTHRNKERY